MIVDLTLGVKNMKISKVFYDSVLGILGYSPIKTELDHADHPVAVGYGKKGEDAHFWIQLPSDMSIKPMPCNGNRATFRAKTPDEIYAISEIAKEKGGEVLTKFTRSQSEKDDDDLSVTVLDPDGHVIRFAYPKGLREVDDQAKKQRIELEIMLTSRRKLSEFLLGIAMIGEWVFSVMFYWFFVMKPQEMDFGLFSASNMENPLVDYIFKSMPLVFLAAMLFYYEKKQYRDAHAAAFGTVIVPLTGWGFLAITNGLGWIVYKLSFALM